MHADYTACCATGNHQRLHLYLSWHMTLCHESTFTLECTAHNTEWSLKKGCCTILAHMPYPLWVHRERKLYSELNTAIQIGIIPLQTLFSVFIPYNTAFLSRNINVFESHKHSLLFKKHLWFLSQHNRQRSLFMRHNLYITVPHQVYCVPSLLQLNQPRSHFSTNIFIFTQQMY